MKSVLFVLFCLIFIGCSDKLAKDRINLATTLIEHPDKVTIILDSTVYNCDHSKNKTIFNLEILNSLKNNKYKFFDEGIIHIESSEFYIEKYGINKIDTVYAIVFNKEVFERHFITLMFKQKNTQWCLDTALNVNVFDFHIDY